MLSREVGYRFRAYEGPHRALSALAIGTMWRGDPSTALDTMLERAGDMTKHKEDCDPTGLMAKTIDTATEEK